MDNACAQCPAASRTLAAKPVAVELQADGTTWRRLPEDCRVHLLALFRDPGIVDSRTVSEVLDLHETSEGSLRAGAKCWVKPFLEALPNLRPGLKVGLDNGVRCPYPKVAGEYGERAGLCIEGVIQHLVSLKHPDGGHPGPGSCHCLRES